MISCGGWLHIKVALLQRTSSTRIMHGFAGAWLCGSMALWQAIMLPVMAGAHSALGALSLGCFSVPERACQRFQWHTLTAAHGLHGHTMKHLTDTLAASAGGRHLCDWPLTPALLPFKSLDIPHAA